MFTSTTTLRSTFACFEAAASEATFRSLSTPTIMSVARESWTKRSIAIGPAISLASRMLWIPLPASDFRLAQRGAGDANGALRQLPPRKSRALVILIVRAQPGWPIGKESRHLFEIRFHGRHVDEQGRCSYL